MAINCYYINNNSFNGLQISNLNTQELLIHFIIVFSQLFSRSVKPNIRFLIKTSKLSILLIACMVPARRAKLGKIQGGCRGPAKIRQRGGCNIFFTFYAIKMSLFIVSTLRV